MPHEVCGKTAETLSIMSQMPHEVCGKTACLIETEKLVDPNSTLNHDSLPSAYVHPLNLAGAIESSYPAVFVFGSDSLSITCKACDTNMSLSSRNALWNIAQHVQSPTHNAAIKAREHIQKNSLLQFGFKIAVGSSSVPEKKRLPSRDLICRGYYLSTCVYGGNSYDITCLQSRNQKSMEYGLCDELVLRKCDGDEKNYILHTGTLRFGASSFIYIHCCLHRLKSSLSKLLLCSTREEKAKVGRWAMDWRLPRIRLMPRRRKTQGSYM